MAVISASFFAWAEAYDTAGSSQRGLVTHETWLADQPAQVLRLDSRVPVDDLVGAVLAVIGRLASSGGGG